MPREIDVQSQDLTAWEAWARWPNLWHAARAGAALGAGMGVVSLIIADLRRVFSATITHGSPLRMLLAGALLIVSSAGLIGLLSVIIAAAIRLFRRAYLLAKHRELARQSSVNANSSQHN